MRQNNKPLVEIEINEEPLLEWLYPSDTYITREDWLENCGYKGSKLYKSYVLGFKAGYSQNSSLLAARDLKIATLESELAYTVEQLNKK